MTIKDLRAGAFAAALLAAALVSAPATANTGPDPAFSALQNVEAQSLTPAEMQAIAGELNAAEIAAALSALAVKYAAFPKLSAFYSALAAYTLANASTINAKLMRLGLYTP
jgi:anthranilate phosphoribosyltransferase